ncbi:MAG: helix-turn-helix domain-containing protein [Chloroflexi bacterium]|nr:MAG: helix-turn-helix domain-containing protein [Chloroflexota bacterium]
MSLSYEERLSDSLYVEKVTHGWTTGEGSTIRPAEVSWHMILTRHSGGTQFLLVGPLETSGVASWGGEAEILWIKFKLGAFMPHLPTKDILESETPLPEASSQSFWLKSSAWQFPDYDNADTFVQKLVREEVLAYDPLVNAVLQGEPQDISPRTVRHRFLRATGLTQSHILQFERARRAEKLLQQGHSILDTVYEAGYFDQPHLTRSLKQFIGYTPAQIIRMSQPTFCRSVQDTLPLSEYDETNVLTNIS